MTARFSSSAKYRPIVQKQAIPVCVKARYRLFAFSIRPFSAVYK